MKEQLHFNDNSDLRIWRLKTILERGRDTVFCILATLNLLVAPVLMLRFYGFSET
jgi:hypothetical protein